MNQLYTTRHENIVMKREPRHMADTVSYMLSGDICEILDWKPEHIALTDKLNKNFVRIKLQHDWYEWHVLSGQLEKYGQDTSHLDDHEVLDMNQSLLMIAAHEYMGAPYLRWWRMTTGIDCSWLSQQIYAKFGIQLLRDAREQITQWVEVSYENLQAGDLLFFEEIAWSGAIKHVWLFVENGKILHASEQWTANVRVDTLDPRGIINTHGEVANIFVSAKRYI